MEKNELSEESGNYLKPCPKIDWFTNDSQRRDAIERGSFDCEITIRKDFKIPSTNFKDNTRTECVPFSKTIEIIKRTE